MSEATYLPAGYSDDEYDGYGEYEGYYFEETAKNKRVVQKSEIEDFKDSLMQDLKNNDVDGLREKLDKGTSTRFDIDTAFDGHWNLLCFACSYGYFDVVEFLAVERGACLNTIIDGETPLMIACSSRVDSKEILQIVKLLHQIEPKLINKTNYLGENALMLAALLGHLCVVEYLMKIGESYDVISNSGRNVLFYAIEGKHTDVACLLLDAGIDLDVQDCYGTTAKKYAEDCNATDILELFPPEEYKYETPSSYYSYNSIEQLFPDTFNENAIPSYFPDIVTMLRGMDCEKFITLFSQANVTLEEFLTIDEDGLERIGIPLPYQRKIILLGLHRFFKGKFTNKSIYIPENIKTHLTPVDLIHIFANVLRQTIILKSQLIYLKRLKADYGINYPHERLPIEQLRNFQNLINELRLKMKTMKPTKRPLLIDRQNQSIKPNMFTTTGKARRALIFIVPLAVISIITIKFLVQK